MVFSPADHDWTHDVAHDCLVLHEGNLPSAGQDVESVRADPVKSTTTLTLQVGPTR